MENEDEICKNNYEGGEKEIKMDFLEVPNINLNKKETEEEVIDEKMYSPSKYFGKRPSFEFRNLKKIERTTHRAFSAIHKVKDQYIEKSPTNVSAGDSNSIPDMENSKVHFSAQIIEDEKENILSPQIPKTKKPKKSILKKSHYNEEITLENIFNFEINREFIDKISMETAKEGKHFSEKLPKMFSEYWKNIGQNKNTEFLKVFN